MFDQKLTGSQLNLPCRKEPNRKHPAVTEKPRDCVCPWNLEIQRGTILKSLHWLKVNEGIEYKLLSLLYTVLTGTQPSYLHNILSSTQGCLTWL